MQETRVVVRTLSQLKSHSHTVLHRCVAMDKVKAAVPGTAEHKLKKADKDIQKDETKAVDAGNKAAMGEGDKLKSHVPGTTDHKLTHQ